MILRGEPECMEKNLFQYNLVYRKSHMEYPRIEPAIP